jgi:hypothetical protein
VHGPEEEGGVPSAVTPYTRHLRAVRLRQALNLRLAASCFGLNLSGKGETADVAALAAAVTVAGLLTFLSVSRHGHRVDGDLL